MKRIPKALICALALTGSFACNRPPAGNDTNTSTTHDSTTDDSTTDDSTSTTSNPADYPCENSQVAPQLDVEGDFPSGLEFCEDGRIHAVAAPTCLVPTSNFWPCTDPTPGSCVSDDECTDQPYGHCQQEYGPGDAPDPTTCGCTYGCETDDDCGEPNTACICLFAASTQSMCIPVDCRTDSDCEAGRLCKYDSFCTAFDDSLHCETDADDCVIDDDCGPGELCRWSDEDTRWLCKLIECG